METPIEKSFADNFDGLPLPVKVVVAWFYLIALFYFFSTISFVDGRFNLSLNNLIFACFALMSAWGLGAKRNTSRLIAIGLAAWRLVEYVYYSWVVIKFWFETSRIAEVSMNWWGKEYSGFTVNFFFGITTVMYIFSTVILLQPHIREMFFPKQQITSEQ